MEVHILNGDSLKEQFPISIEGETIVARECLVDGDVSGSDLETLFLNRANFLSEAYQINPEDYQKTIFEFQKIINVKAGSTINLWFEDDLFCQVNLWYCVYLIRTYTKEENVYLIRPNNDIQYGFGGLNQKGLIKTYMDKKKISGKGLYDLSLLWRCYQSNNIKQMTEIAVESREEFPFLTDVVSAHCDRIPTNDFPGRPKKAIREIIEELGTSEFSPVFQEFKKRESIYGFGDLQVKKLMEELKDQ